MAAADSLVRDDAAAIRHADAAVALGVPRSEAPLKQVYANALLRKGDYAGAGKLLAAGLPEAVDKAGGAAVIRQVYSAISDHEKLPSARAALRRLAQVLDSRPVDANSRKDLIAAFVMLGDIDGAYDYANRSLDEMVKAGMIGGAWGVLWTPEMRPFRIDPRFQAFATRLGLMEFWQQFGDPDDCSLAEGRLRCR